jgi:hypothetical protein
LGPNIFFNTLYALITCGTKVYSKKVIE